MILAFLTLLFFSKDSMEHWMRTISALIRMYLTFHLISEEGENAVRLIGEAAREKSNNAVLRIHR
jgi:hypothetical protein